MAKKVAGTSGIFAANARTVATRVGELACLKHDKFIGHSLEFYGEWAQNEIDRLADYIKPGDFVLDVGANVGFHALSFARQVGHAGQVWAFEPDPVNALLLRLNVVNSGMDNVVVPFDLAVSDAVGLCRFRSYPISMPENFGHAAVDAQAGDYPRAAIALDALTMERVPALIKIDIEGHELAALEGMRELIERSGPVLSIEADTEADAERICAFASELGYDVHDFVTNAFNPTNFAGRDKDVWNGHGKCANLLCILPGKHATPEGLPVRRAASPGGSGLARVGRSLSAAYISGASDISLSTDSKDVKASDSSALRADVRNFVGTFLRSTYGKLDPQYYSAVVNSALDYLSADGASAEGAALRTFVVSGIEAFANAVTRANEDAEKLVKLEAELQTAQSQAAELADAKECEARASDALIELEQRYVTLGVAHNESNETLDRLRDEMTKLSADLDRAKGDAEAAREASSQLNLALARQSAAGASEVGQLRTDLKDAHAKIASLAQLKTELEAANAAGEVDRAETSQELERIRRELQETAVGRDALLDEQRDALARAQELQEMLVGENSTIAEELAALRARHEDALARLATQVVEIRRLRSIS